MLARLHALEGENERLPDRRPKDKEVARNNRRLWLLGKPNELMVSRVTVHAFDYHNTKMSNAELNVANKIATWMPTPILKGTACFRVHYPSLQSAFKTANETRIQVCS